MKRTRTNEMYRFMVILIDEQKMSHILSLFKTTIVLYKKKTENFI